MLSLKYFTSSPSGNPFARPQSEEGLSLMTWSQVRNCNNLNLHPIQFFVETGLIGVANCNAATHQLSKKVFQRFTSWTGQKHFSPNCSQCNFENCGLRLDSYMSLKVLLSFVCL